MAENEKREILKLKRKSPAPTTGAIDSDKIISHKRKLIIPGKDSASQNQGQIVTLQEVPARQAKAARATRKPKPEKRVSLEQALLMLSAYWPDCFDRTEVKIMKIKIREDMFNDREQRQLPISRKQIRHCLKAVAQSPAYLKCMAPGSVRYDIHGQPAGVVSENEALRAKKLISL
ncbi:hypothetical protein I2494_17765 [Budviciaceae bacterium BWR-B9]|uniref:ProQ/FinO domain-containing protein n=1 Tax=Limnobaculum allomyrinae TaxID=2791986 RepID=A0ABS1IUU4_9GAMM|nr:MULTISPECIES: ProQ/FINO family protein [Limnobaculum]MBK5145529.1 hypothetical protein [Limnobaculum allomyrinae]MBV7693648.1 hypothetical protein [Limnobaculum sp. M2-1]